LTDEELEHALPVQWISKEARFKIIDAMLATRSTTELARVLGISPAAVRKYIKRVAHPSDAVLARALASTEMYEKPVIMEIIIDDILEALKRLYNSVDEKYKGVIKEKISAIIGAKLC
jgi:predicted transcriptional regulator